MLEFASKIGMRDDLFMAYTKDLRENAEWEPLTPEEERRTIEAYRNGDMSARDKILLANQGMVIKIAKTYANSDTLTDLISVGNIGLATAFEKFDPDNDKGADGKPAKFMSFAVWYIRRDIIKYILESQPVQKSNYNKTYSKVNKIKEEFYQREMRYPTPDEICDILLSKHQLSIKDVSDLYDVSYSSIDSPIGGSEDEGTSFGDSSAFNTKTASYNGYEEKMNKDQLHDDMTRLLGCLKERERTIMMMSTGMGYDREYTTDEIAESLNLTKERVRQLRMSTAAKMKKLYPSVVGKAI